MESRGNLVCKKTGQFANDYVHWALAVCYLSSGVIALVTQRVSGWWVVGLLMTNVWLLALAVDSSQDEQARTWQRFVCALVAFAGLFIELLGIRSGSSLSIFSGAAICVCGAILLALTPPRPQSRGRVDD